MTWQNRFDRLLKAMTQGEPPKRPSASGDPQDASTKPEAGKQQDEK